MRSRDRVHHSVGRGTRYNTGCVSDGTKGGDSVAKRSKKRRGSGLYTPGALPPTASAVGRWRTALPFALAIAFALVLAVGTAFNGLYFPNEQLIYLLIVAALVVILLFVAGVPRPLLRGPLDWLVLGFVGCYALSLAVAVHPNAALQAVLLRAMYFLVFWAVAQLTARSPQLRPILLWGLLLGGAIVTVIGIGAAAGTIPYPGAFLGGRIYSSIQYPDSAAAYLAATAFIAIGFKLSERRPVVRMLYGLSATSSIMVFVFALSRGAEIVFVPVVLFLVGVWILRRNGALAVDAAAAIVIPLIGVAASVLPYTHGLRDITAKSGHGPLLVWSALAAALIVSCVLDLGWMRLRRVSARTQLGFAIGAGAALVVLATVADVTLHLGHTIFARLGHLSPDVYNAWSRIRWWRDALRIVVRHPILGVGGGGWNAVYHSVQSYGYFTTQVHNGWIQVWVATGTVGLLVWLGIIGFGALAVVRAFRQANDPDRVLLIGVAAAAAMILLHGFLDFTLEIPAIAIAFWAMLGIFRSFGPPVAASRGAEPTLLRLSWGHAAMAVGLVMAVALASTQLASQHALSAGSRLADDGNYPAGIARFKEAVSLDPWSVTAHLDLAELDAAAMNLASDTASYQSAAATQYGEAVALDPYNVSTRTAYASFLRSLGDEAEAFTQLKQVLADGPFLPSTYEEVAIAGIDAGLQDLVQKDILNATEDLNFVVQLPTRLAEESARVPLPARGHYANPLEPNNPAVDLSVGEADAAFGDWSGAQKMLTPLLNAGGQVGGEANLWDGMVLEKTGASGSAALLHTAQTDLTSLYAGQLSIVKEVLGALRSPS